MRKILVVIDMQRDFIDGALGTAEARAIVPAVIEKIKGYVPEDVFATRDTHGEDYLNTQEGHYLPVKHCIRGTDGWELDAEIAALIPKDHIFDKGTFGSTELAAAVKELAARESVELELIGLCTGVCVVSNMRRRWRRCALVRFSAAEFREFVLSRCLAAEAVRLSAGVNK